jgi:hypothetical protein
MNKSNHCVISFGFCRPDALARSILSIKQNYSESKNYTHILVVDRAHKSNKHFRANQLTIEFAHTLKENGLVDLLTVRDQPFGTQQNIILGVTDAALKYRYLFVVEDDLQLIHYHKNLSPFFFRHHLNDTTVAFTTYSHLMTKNRSSSFLSHRFSSQSWGVTSDVWLGFDVEQIRNLNFSDTLKKDLSKHLGTDMPSAIVGFKSGTLDSWAIPWNVHNFLEGNLMAYPSKSFVVESGSSVGATRTTGIKFKSELATDFFDYLNWQKSPNFAVNETYIEHFNFLNRGLRKIKSKFWSICL